MELAFGVINIIGMLIGGLITGLLARAVVPGKDAMGILPTMLLGLVGSFVAIGATYLFGFDAGSLVMWLMAIGGAAVALLIYNRVVARRAT